LCDTALLCAFSGERTVVDAELVKAAVEELQWVEFSERMREQQGHGDTGKFTTAERPTARLEMLYRDQLVGEFRIGLGKAIIGRTADNDVQIQSRFISRHHAQVVSDQTQSVLEDLNSTNGVFIRSQRVKHQTLVDGDIIQIGEHKLLYRDMRHAGGKELIGDEDDDDLDDDLDDEDGDEDGDEDRDDDADEAEEEELDERPR
jgi:general secretion pathway protein A